MYYVYLHTEKKKPYKEVGVFKFIEQYLCTTGCMKYFILYVVCGLDFSLLITMFQEKQLNEFDH